MKRTLSVLLVLLVIALLASCDSGNGGKAQTPSQKTDAGSEQMNENNSSDIDVDLTKLSSTMVYSEVYNMMNTPENYVGKTVKMKGAFSLYEGEERNYYACIIKDATACCQQGMEFVWKGDHSYPEDYPELGDDITVTGVFETYYEGENMYCQLNNSEVSFK